jgi:protease-4
MALDADAIVDRRRLRRSLTLWRTLAILLVALAIGAAAFAFGGSDWLARHEPHIARLSITGVITDDRRQVRLIERLADNPSVAGVIVSINSPGGTTVGGEVLYEALRKLAEKKPVAAHIATLGASAGYLTAIAADHIVARRNAITGSIGVLFQYGDAAGLLDTLGVRLDAAKSGSLKAEPAPWAPASEEAKAVLQGVVEDSFVWFRDLVVERRGLDAGAVALFSDGRIFTGHQAVEAGLVDTLGGEDAAVDWMERERGVAADLPVRDWRLPPENSGVPFLSSVGEGFGRSLARSLLETAGFPVADEAGRLDGLRSLWQAPALERGDRFEGATR